jgi:hypothetical protein
MQELRNQFPVHEHGYLTSLENGSRQGGRETQHCNDFLPERMLLNNCFT